VGDQSKIIVKTYTGSQDKAMKLYQTDSSSMANQGYFPASQSWAPGRWTGGDFFVALILCFIFIGFLVFVYMLVVTPKGTLSVTYELRASSVEEKTCPKCAEKIKAAAVVCRFCGHEFTIVQNMREGITDEKSISEPKVSPIPKNNLNKSAPISAHSRRDVLIGLIILAMFAIATLIWFQSKDKADAHAEQVSTPLKISNGLTSRTPIEYVVAPGGKVTYYIMSVPGKDADGNQNTEIEAGVDGNSSFNVLLTPTPGNDAAQNLTGFSHLFLSPDSKTLYFQTEAWVTSNAIHAMNLTTKKVSYVTSGTVHCVVLSGEHQGDLVVEQHRYFAQGGSYNALWLYDPSGKEIDLVSQDTDSSRVCPSLGN